ncbi:hypothetical protein Tco_1375228, partial [Tanacetum coccineum]
IFRYLKGQSKLGLWYPKDLLFKFEAYTDSDYAGASLDRKSITGAEYAQMMLKTAADDAIQFWQTATASTLDNGVMEITATIDGKVKIVTEASIRRHLKLEDSDGISNFPTTKFFEQLALMGSPTQTYAADEATSIGVDVRYGGTATTVTSLDAGQGSGNIDKTPSMPYDSPLPRGHTLGSNEGVQHDVEVQGRHEHDFEFTAVEEVYTAEKGVSTAEPVSTAGASVSTASASSAKDKGKPIIEEAKTIQTKTKLQLEQERLGYEEGLRLKAEIDEEERQRIARVQEEASSFNIEEWDDIQARVKADEEFAQRLKSEEREMYSKAKKARLLAELINERKRYFAVQRAEERRNKPLIQAQRRTYMS